ncbi:MAG: S-layer homology domain-containing protein [Clostridia bacterium]|nr:S-layer homology domain-containing protein [Clostridia bacterium]
MIKRISNNLLIYTLIIAMMAVIFPVGGISAAAAPSALTLTIVDGRQIKLTWIDTLSNETGYRIDRKADNGTFTEVGSTFANSREWNDYNASAGVTYTYRVRSIDSSGNSTIHTDEVSVTTSIIDRPATLTVTAVSSSQIDLTWTYPGSRSFDTVVERSLTGGTNGSWHAIATLPAGTNNYSDKGLGTNIQYWYRIKAVYNSNIFSAYCPYESGSWVFTKLNAPIDIYGYAASSTQIFLSWKDTSDRTLYFDIERKDGEDGEFRVVGTARQGAVSWVDSGLTTNNTYTYRIRAKSPVAIPVLNYSNYTEEITVKCVYLMEPTYLTAVASSNFEVQLEWKDNSNNETEFEIWRKAGTEAKWEKYASVDRNVTSYTDSNVSSDLSYSYKVRGHMLYNDAYSAFTNEAGVWTVQLNPPTGLQALVSTGGEIKLIWEDNSRNETGFAVERKAGIDGKWIEIAFLPSNTSSYTDKNLSNTEQYFYRVKVYESTYYKSFTYSEEIQASAKLPASPSDVSAKAISSSNIKISWKDNYNDELGFRIERRPGNSWTYEEVGQALPNTASYLDSGLAPGTGYYYRVCMFDNSGDSAYSKEVYVSTLKGVSFKDVPAAYWAKSEIENLASRGVFKAKSGGYFKPNEKITRGEFAYILVKALKLNKTVAGSFADVTSKHTYYKEIMIADKMGIITKSKNNCFYPERAVTRQDMAVFVSRALKAIDKPLREFDLSILDGFTDKKYVSAGVINNIASMFGEGVMTGKTKSGKKVIAPWDTVTRADAAVVIYKIIDRE